MERLFKVSNVYQTTIKAKNEGDAPRPKTEVTLTYHAMGFSSQKGTYIRHQDVVISLLDQAAETCPLLPGMWIVGEVSLVAYNSRTEPGHYNQGAYLDSYIIVSDWSQL